MSSYPESTTSADVRGLMAPQKIKGKPVPPPQQQHSMTPAKKK